MGGWVRDRGREAVRNWDKTEFVKCMAKENACVVQYWVVAMPYFSRNCKFIVNFPVTGRFLD